MSDRTVVVPHRIYTEVDGFGHRKLLHGAGSRVSWETAVGLGLVEGRSLPEDQIPFQVPRDLYEGDGPTRMLVHRAGSMITLDRARALGLVADAAEEHKAPEAETEEKPERPEEQRTPGGRQVRTTKVPNPES